MHPFALACVVSLVSCTALCAQTPPQQPPGAGIDRHDGAVRAVGADYAARFDAGGVTFTAALGARVADPVAVHCRLAHVQRGALRVFEPQGDVPPSSDERQVRYQHSPWLTEVHDVRHDGVEQSFVFAERPAGDGDLVVGVRIATDLERTAHGPEGVRYERPGAGGVTFGAVTGIDARGDRAAGALHVDGDLLLLSLPASFVDRAAYPLVLDPMIGTTVTIGNGAGGIDRQPSVAFDETTQRYLVVWNVELTATDAEVWAQFVTALGNPIGNPILVDGNARTGLRPAVANVNDSDRFLLAWGRAAMQGSTSYTQARYASMTAANGTLSASTYFAGNATLAVTGVAVGGNSRESAVATYDEALVVATLYGGTSGTGSAYAWPVLVPASGNPASAGSLTTLYQGVSGFGSVAVTKHAGNGGRWLITLGSAFLATASVVSSNGTLCAQAQFAVGFTAFDTAVATRDGAEFLIAFADSLQGTVQTRRATWSGTCASGTLVLGPALDPVQAPGHHRRPELDCARDKYVLSWETGATSASQHDIRVRGLSLVDGSPAGATYYAGGASTPLLAETGSAIASRWSGGDAASDEALVVWSSGVIVGRRFEATGTGSVTSLGGACGITGLTDVATYNGTPALGTTFTIELLAPTAPVLALIVGFSQAPVACGPCTIVPSADVVLAGGAPVPVTVPLDPNLIGFELYTQWLQWRSSGCALLPAFGFSNTLKFTVAE